MSKENEKMKGMVESLVANLGKAGVKVNSAAILNMEDDNSPASQKAFMEAMQKSGFQPGGPQPELREGKKAAQANIAEEELQFCGCPNCFTFESFEKMLSLMPGNKNFYYQEIDVEGEKFDLKICKSDARGVEFMIGKRPAPITSTDFEKYTTQDLTEALNVAVKQKDFGVSQVILTEINKRNKNQ